MQEQKNKGRHDANQELLLLSKAGSQLSKTDVRCRGQRSGCMTRRSDASCADSSASLFFLMLHAANSAMRL